MGLLEFCFILTIVILVCLFGFIVAWVIAVIFPLSDPPTNAAEQEKLKWIFRKGR